MNKMYYLLILTANENYDNSICQKTNLHGKADGNEVKSVLTPYQLPYNLNKGL